MPGKRLYPVPLQLLHLRFQVHSWAPGHDGTHHILIKSGPDKLVGSRFPGIFQVAKVGLQPVEPDTTDTGNKTEAYPVLSIFFFDFQSIIILAQGVSDGN